ncbi:MAG: 2-oxo acid dehydrogenase subunit E2 [Mycobacterium leprae]
MNVAGTGPQIVPVDPLRQVAMLSLEIARHTVVPVTGVAEVDATNLKALHDRMKPEFEASTRVPLTYTAFFARAAALALQANPVMNASFSPQGYLLHPTVNLGVATQVPGGVLIPVIRDAERKSVPELAWEIAANANRARARQVTPAEMSTATFVITNPGRFGAMLFGTPVIMPSCVGSMGFESIQKRPVVLANDQIVARPMMYISLTCDHRAVDGADMARFCTAVKQILEQLKF